MKKEQIDHIRQLFISMESKEDFVGLLNVAKEYLVETVAAPFTLNTLLYYSDNTSSSSRYTVFTIKKKSGGSRRIMAPVGELKSILRCLNFVLQCVHVPHEAAMGFTPERSIVSNARLHIKKRFVYNIDLKDFFHSFSEESVKLAFTDSPFNLSESKQPIADLISKLCTHSTRIRKFTTTVLPQGSPTSPVISNILCYGLDNSLTRLAEEYDATYSRYADDITFSSQNEVFETRTFLWDLRKIIEGDYNLLINSQKTRLQKKNYRQEATGLVINEKTNVRRRFIKQIRMWLYYWGKYGFSRAQELFLNDYHYPEKVYIESENPNLINVLDGKLHFLKMVKGEEDSTYQKLLQRFDQLSSLKSEADLKVTTPNPNHGEGYRKTSSLNGYQIIRIRRRRKYGFSSIYSKLSRSKHFLGSNENGGHIAEVRSDFGVNELWRKILNDFRKNGTTTLQPVQIQRRTPNPGNIGTLISWSNENHLLWYVDTENVFRDTDASIGLASKEDGGILYELRKPSSYKFGKDIVNYIKSRFKERYGTLHEEYINSALAYKTHAEKAASILSIVDIANVLFDTDSKGFDKEFLEDLRKKTVRQVFGVKEMKPGGNIMNDSDVYADVDYNGYLKQALDYQKAFNAFERSPDLGFDTFFDLDFVAYDIDNKKPQIQEDIDKGLKAEFRDAIPLADNPYPYVNVVGRNGEITQYQNLVHWDGNWYHQVNDEFVPIYNIRPLEGLIDQLGPYGSQNFIVSERRSYEGVSSYDKIFINKPTISGAELFTELKEYAEQLREGSTNIQITEPKFRGDVLVGSIGSLGEFIPSEIETKIAGIEKSKREDLLLVEKIVESVTPSHPNHPHICVGMPYDEEAGIIYVEKHRDYTTNGEGGFAVITRIVESAEINEKGILIKPAKVHVSTFDGGGDASRFLKREYENARLKAINDKLKISKNYDDILKPLRAALTKRSPFAIIINENNPNEAEVVLTNEDRVIITDFHEDLLTLAKAKNNHVTNTYAVFTSNPGKMELVNGVWMIVEPLEYYYGNKRDFNIGKGEFFIRDIHKLSKVFIETYFVNIEGWQRWGKPTIKFKTIKPDATEINFTISYGDWSFNVNIKSGIAEILVTDIDNGIIVKPERFNIARRRDKANPEFDPSLFSFIDYRRNVYSGNLRPKTDTSTPVKKESKKKRGNSKDLKARDILEVYSADTKPVLIRTYTVIYVDSSEGITVIDERPGALSWRIDHSTATQRLNAELDDNSSEKFRKREPEIKTISYLERERQEALESISFTYSRGESGYGFYPKSVKLNIALNVLGIKKYRHKEKQHLIDLVNTTYDKELLALQSAPFVPIELKDISTEIKVVIAKPVESEAPTYTVEDIIKELEDRRKKELKDAKLVLGKKGDIAFDKHGREYSIIHTFGGRPVEIDDYKHETPASIKDLYVKDPTEINKRYDADRAVLETPSLINKVAKYRYFPQITLSSVDWAASGLKDISNFPTDIVVRIKENKGRDAQGRITGTVLVYGGNRDDGTSIYETLEVFFNEVTPPEEVKKVPSSKSIPKQEDNI